MDHVRAHRLVRQGVRIHRPAFHAAFAGATERSRMHPARVCGVLAQWDGTHRASFGRTRAEPHTGRSLWPPAQRKAVCQGTAQMARLGFMTPVEVAEGVFLLALPLGIHRIPSINAYLFVDPAGDTLVDCGIYANPPARPGEGNDTAVDDR